MSTAGVIAPPPRPDLLTSNSRPGGFFSKSNFLGFINFSNCENSLKLRHQFKASDQFRLEVGLDYNVQKKTARPWTGVKLLLDTTDETGWAVEFNSDWAVLCTPTFDLIPFTNKLSLPIGLRVGTDFYTSPEARHLEIGIHNSKITLLLLVASLVAKQPINIKRKETGGFITSVPISLGKNGSATRSVVDHTLYGKTEIDTTLQRTGKRGVSVVFHQLNALLRLRQDG